MNPRQPSTEELVQLYLTAKTFVIERGFAHEIAWQSSPALAETSPSAFVREAAWVVLSAGILLTLILVLLRQGYSAASGGHILCAAAVYTYTTLAMLNGGITAPATMWFASVPVFAMLLLDTAKLDEMTQRLEPLTQPTSSFRHTARELLALSAWRNGDAAAARKWAEAAGSDPEVPPGIRARAEVLNSLLADTSKT